MLTVIPTYLEEAVEKFLEEIQEKTGETFTKEIRIKNKDNLLLYGLKYGELPEMDKLIDDTKIKQTQSRPSKSEVQDEK